MYNHSKQRAAQQRIDRLMPDDSIDGCDDCDLKPSTNGLQLCTRCGCGYADIPGYGQGFLSREEVEVWLSND